MKVRPSTQTLMQPPRPHARSSLRVLLVDDDPVTSSPMVRDCGDCREAGMDSMLRKPFGRGDLADVTVRVVG